MTLTSSAAGGGKLSSELLLYRIYLYLKRVFLELIANLSLLNEKGGGKLSDIPGIFVNLPFLFENGPPYFC